MNAEIGKGIYTIPDIASILILPINKVRRWVKEYWDGKLYNKEDIHYSWGFGKEKAVNFYTLVELYVFFQLRNHGFSTKKIFKAHEIISKDFNTYYPFATSKLLAGNKNIFFYAETDIIVKANDTKQIGINIILEKFCKKIDFGYDFLAERYWPIGKNKSIVIDPKHQFGQPIVNNTNILAATLYYLYKAGETKDNIALLYDINKINIDDAIEYYNRAS